MTPSTNLSQGIVLGIVLGWLGPYRFCSDANPTSLSILLNLVIPNLLSDNLIKNQIGSFQIGWFHFPKLRAKNHHVVIGTQCVEAHNANQRTCPPVLIVTVGLPDSSHQAAETKTINSRLWFWRRTLEISNWQNIMTDQPTPPLMHPSPQKYWLKKSQPY